MSQDAQRIDPSVVPGATPAPFPGFVDPCHPALRQGLPSGAGWVHEIKFDGYRAQAQRRGGQPAIYTRRGHDWTLRFQPIADALVALSAQDLILDFEAVVAEAAAQIASWTDATVAC
jgi:bifunctional non-homologous end joining protein LigD